MILLNIISLARFVAAGFGSGWFPVAPGTAGSLAALLPAWWMVSAYGLYGLLGIFLLFIPLACWSTYVALPHMTEKDPGWIVIDEWLGQWLTLLLILPLMGASWLTFALGFAAFRLFDIWKPGLVKRVEHLGPVWWSIHADDLLAGVYAGFLLGAGYMVAMQTGVLA
ncbi:MAG: phosphatidylglycerophosphatase A [Zetaproteobacteria bacterium CG06_land_8_20_14_3_00_59_53]|nr:MAG: hypothetical protein AUK36_05965 [Zetaproteobacteria bacterium CG2_30_59_37]PIO90595.1 MAG: phosphatidylglycerophosphatase A [Zetaproteobacteria bacterium CG23_combo_of_CG06-09_8_20_14_all_59_86]PIQ66139.1 MAG: phosphatidylglycerophosphatase A [Zetaproteobacteria bacterium CG11_big_fil_rev_8_21_14_0_20_59_439]PIU71542.1 MAG: phosphatidylglycerophosphatase A [Zetaproteobacteria bacterium CG06_land_8_20_14_3_00_59_53]PIU97802.1 MAG: phosphatidylglycerophosphatase A [Zetaproteobacteria bac